MNYTLKGGVNSSKVVKPLLIYPRTGSVIPPRTSWVLLAVVEVFITEVWSHDGMQGLAFRDFSPPFLCRAGAVSTFLQASLEALLGWGEGFSRWGGSRFSEALAEGMDHPRDVPQDGTEHQYSSLRPYQGIQQSLILFYLRVSTSSNGRTLDD